MFCLIFSLIESKIILPSHLAHINVHKKPANLIARLWARVQGGVSGGLNRFVSRIYQPLLRRLFGLRYVVLFAFLSILVLVAGLMPAGKLRFVFFPDIFRDELAANIELEQGLPVEYLHEQSLRVTDALLEVTREFEGRSGERILEHVHTAASTNTRAAIAAQLTPSEERSVSTAEIVSAWRRRVGSVAGAKALSFSGRMGPPRGDLEILLESGKLDSLRAAADQLKARVATYPGVHDVQDSFDSGRPEIRLELTPEGEAAGIDKRRLAQNARDAFYGREAQRVQRGRDEVKVMVRYPLDDRRRLDTLREMRVRTTDGAAVPFSIVADARHGEALASIERADFRRVVTVSGEIDKAVTSNEAVLERLKRDYFPTLRGDFPDVEIALRGAAEQRARSMRSLRNGFILSIVLIYILLSIPLKSYTRPLFIMSVIPFGIVGAMLGHLALGMSVSILSIFGILALSGVVVNDSLVLLHRIDALRAANPGLTLADAIHEAAGQRFRAILLTSLTTFVGLVPLLAETQVQAQFLKPMAVSLGFGVLFATVITLVLLPMILLIARDLRLLIAPSFAWWGRLLGGRRPEPEA
jgi:multidrug efflux pump subunit AcrB